jgi:hypothetical protein
MSDVCVCVFLCVFLCLRVQECVAVGYESVECARYKIPSHLLFL